MAVLAGTTMWRSTNRNMATTHIIRFKIDVSTKIEQTPYVNGKTYDNWFKINYAFTSAEGRRTCFGRWWAANVFVSVKLYIFLFQSRSINRGKQMYRRVDTAGRHKSFRNGFTNLTSSDFYIKKIALRSPNDFRYTVVLTFEITPDNRIDTLIVIFELKSILWRFLKIWYL